MPIVVENLSYHYMQGTKLQFKALSDINITIEEGEFLGIIGHTGSGKSTFVQHLNGLLQPTEGKVLVDGHDMADKKQRHKGRELVGMVFQYPEYQLFEETVYKDVAFGPKNIGISPEEIPNRVREAMELMGLDYNTIKDKSPFELSGGQKRRAALAGIIAMRPKYLVLDEPMAGLDPGGRKQIIRTVEELRKALNCAIIMVSHSMDDISGNATRIAVLNSGTIMMADTPNKVFKSPKLLMSMGLDIPQITRLISQMNARGANIPENIFKPDDMLEYLKGRLEHV